MSQMLGSLEIIREGGGDEYSQTGGGSAASANLLTENNTGLFYSSFAVEPQWTQKKKKSISASHQTFQENRVLRRKREEHTEPELNPVITHIFTQSTCLTRILLLDTLPSNQLLSSSPEPESSLCPHLLKQCLNVPQINQDFKLQISDDLWSGNNNTSCSGYTVRLE